MRMERREEGGTRSKLGKRALLTNVLRGAENIVSDR
jgi:hypothetical protein